MTNDPPRGLSAEQYAAVTYLVEVAHTLFECHEGPHRAWVEVDGRFYIYHVYTRIAGDIAELQSGFESYLRYLHGTAPKGLREKPRLYWRFVPPHIDIEKEAHSQRVKIRTRLVCIDSPLSCCRICNVTEGLDHTLLLCRHIVTKADCFTEDDAVKMGIWKRKGPEK